MATKILGLSASNAVLVAVAGSAGLITGIAFRDRILDALRGAGIPVPDWLNGPPAQSGFSSQPCACGMR